MGLPQILYIALLCTSLGINLAKHGEPQTGKYNFGVALIGVALQLALLNWGGFFN